MIRRSFTIAGQITLFVIGNDRALKRFVESIDFDAPAKAYPVPDYWSEEERAARAARRKPYRRPLWLRVERALDARRRTR